MTDEVPSAPPEAAPMPSPAPAAAPAASVSASSTGSRRRWTLVGIVLVAAIVVVSSLYLLGVPPFPRPAGSGSPHGPVTFSQARAAGDALMNGYQGGSWELLAAGSIMSQANLSFPVSLGSSTFSNCTVRSLLPGSIVPIPAYHGDLRLGASPIWGLIYWGNGSGRIVSVTNGTASPSAEISGGTSCSLLVSAVHAIPSTIADSGTIAQAVMASGGSAFLTAHPTANVTMTVIGGFSILVFSTPPVWQVTYSLCSLTSAHPAPALEFNATIDASGTVTRTHEGTANCTAASAPGGVTLLGRAGALGPWTGPSALRAAVVRVPSP